MDGWIGGYKYSKYNLTSANTIYSGYSNLKDNNRWVIYSSVDNSGITLPKLSEVRDALSIGSSTKFCVEFTIIADLDSKTLIYTEETARKVVITPIRGIRLNIPIWYIGTTIIGIVWQWEQVTVSRCYLYMIQVKVAAKAVIP